jgi:hypothetical protein
MDPTFVRSFNLAGSGVDALRRKIVIAVGLGLLATGCNKNPSNAPAGAGHEILSSSVSYADPAEQAAFKRALLEANIPFEITKGDRGEERVSWNGAYDTKVQAIAERLLGPVPPAGRNIAFDTTTQKEFLDWLKSEGIPFEIVISRGKEYVTWSEADHAKVQQFHALPESFRKAK